MSSSSRERAKQRDRAKKAEEKKIDEGVKVDDADHVVIRRQTDALVDDYKAAYQKLERIKSELRAYDALLRALSKVDRNADSPFFLLTDLAESLITAYQNSHPLQAVAMDPNKVKFSKSPPDIGASTRGARRAEIKLHRQVRGAIETYDESRARNFAPDPNRIPKARCRNADCPADDTWVDSWRVIRGGRRIYAEKCMSCGDPLWKDDSDILQPQQ